jgi:hypothetical protein
MKTRSGFVSNSSSSSFTIWSKKELTTELLMEKLAPGMLKKSTGYEMLSEIFSALVSCVDKETLKEYIDDQSPEDDEILRVTKMIGKGFTLYHGFVSDNGDGPEQYYLCETSLNFKDSDLIIEHEGGY